MIYLCNIKNDELHLQHSFDTDQEFAAYLTNGMFDYILLHQRLTTTDICRKNIYEYGESVLYTYDRDIQILDEFGRILDVRNFAHLIPTNDSVYNVWKKKQNIAFRAKHNNHRQGKTHKKWGHYKYEHSFFPLDKELSHIDVNLRHRNRCLRNVGPKHYIETWKTTENNWKCTKVPYQYMWHKPRHKDTCRMTDVDNSD